MRGRRASAALLAFAGGDAALRIEIEEDVLPALGRKPIPKRRGLETVRARMARKDARHAPGIPSNSWTVPGVREPVNSTFVSAADRAAPAANGEKESNPALGTPPSRYGTWRTAPFAALVAKAA